MVSAVKRISISFPSCMKKLNLSEKKEKRSDDNEKPDVTQAPERSCSVRTLPPDIEYNLRLACRSILRTHQRRQSQQIPVDVQVPGNTCNQAGTDHVTQHDAPQSKPDSEKTMQPPTQPVTHKRKQSQAQVLRTRATSRVDEVMGQPVQIQQETKPDSQLHSPA